MYTMGVLAAFKKIPETRVEYLRKAISSILLTAQKTILDNETWTGITNSKKCFRRLIPNVKFQEYLSNLFRLYFPYFVCRRLIRFFN